MAEDRQLPAERAVELDVLGQRREPLLRADHVGDPHQVIVHHVGEVVGREAVALQQDLVVHLRPLEADLAAQQVADDHRLVLGHGEADDVGLAGARRRAGLRRVEPPAQAVVAEDRGLPRLLLLPQRLSRSAVQKQG